jgi:hypothetical protein
MQSGQKSRLQRKQERIGRKLASYAVTLASEGFIGLQIKAKTRPLFGSAPFIHDNAAEVYAFASKVLAEDGLRIEETDVAFHPGRGSVSVPQARDFGFMTISVIDKLAVEA